MTRRGAYRDVTQNDGIASSTSVPGADGGRLCIAAIGIDRYPRWKRLYNAVSDANGALKAFTAIGFEIVATPLFDEMATGDALRRLVTDDLAGLDPEDSLVLFFAGHGHTVTRTYAGGATVKDGYIIPVDGDQPEGRSGTWLRLESWLTEVTRIPAKHILVVLDACHSGIALGPIIQWRRRGMGKSHKEPLAQLRARRSRRIITSALDDQLAMDGGPVPGHSLFTGCLIEGLGGGLLASIGKRTVTGSEIGHYVQRRVSEYPMSLQTPDFGALELDDRGELVVRIASESLSPSSSARGFPHVAAPPPAPPVSGPSSRRVAVVGGAFLVAAAVALVRCGDRVQSIESVDASRAAPTPAEAPAGTGSMAMDANDDETAVPDAQLLDASSPVDANRTASRPRDPVPKHSNVARPFNPGKQNASSTGSATPRRIDRSD